MEVGFGHGLDGEVFVLVWDRESICDGSCDGFGDSALKRFFFHLWSWPRSWGFGGKKISVVEEAR